MLGVGHGGIGVRSLGHRAGFLEGLHGVGPGLARRMDVADAVEVDALVEARATGACRGAQRVEQPQRLGMVAHALVVIGQLDAAQLIVLPQIRFAQVATGLDQLLLRVDEITTA